MSLCSSARRLSMEGILGYNKAGLHFLFFAFFRKKTPEVAFDLFVPILWHLPSLILDLLKLSLFPSNSFLFSV